MFDRLIEVTPTALSPPGLGDSGRIYTDASHCRHTQAQLRAGRWYLADSLPINCQPLAPLLVAVYPALTAS